MAIINDDISINTLIGVGSFIKGDIKINGFTRIDGDLDGNLETSGNVIIGDNARIRGNITAKSITVGGIVQGNITAPEFIHLLPTSLVLGDIQSKKIQADENVIIHGHCISLSSQDEYEKSSQKWQNTIAMNSKNIFSDFN